MSADNKIVVRRYFEELWNKDNAALIDALIAPDFVLHDPSFPEIRGRDGFKEFFAQGKAAFPDITFPLEDMVAENDKVVVRYTFRGTQQGEFLGRAATGKSVDVAGMAIYRLAAGQIAELWVVEDTLTWMQQLGIVPPIE